jgi:hypothetical protein
LFQLSSDPGETTNLASQHPDRVQSLMEDHLSWRAELATEVKAAAETLPFPENR